MLKNTLIKKPEQFKNVIQLKPYMYIYNFKTEDKNITQMYFPAEQVKTLAYSRR